MNSSVQYIQFGTLSARDWLRYSVAEITRDASQGGTDKDRTGTPYDERMGVLENGRTCLTCHGDNKTCQGHFGHIVLPVPVYNKQFSDYILKILNCVCPVCARLRLTKEQCFLQGITSIKPSKRLIVLAEKCKKEVEICPHEDCSNILATFLYKTEFRRYFGDKNNTIAFSSGEILNVFTRITDEDVEMMGLNYYILKSKIFQDVRHLLKGTKHIHQFRPESTIITVLPVLPPIARPYVIRDQQRCDDDLTDKYNSILKSCAKLEGKAHKSRRKVVKLNEAEKQREINKLMDDIWTMMDNKDDVSKLSSGGRPHKSIKDRICGKYGRLQSNVVGKRSDFSARAVIIGGGTLINRGELGVPEKIAKTLTCPEFITKRNIEYFQSLVDEGKVNRVNRDGKTTRLDLGLPRPFRLQIGDEIDRQLMKGDPVLFNRQPSLRSESMQSFKTVVVKGNAFRMNLSVTSSYNADFDGDEMNLHVPQSPEAVAETEILMKSSKHIITPQRNGPVNGCIQDTLIGSYKLTNTWEECSKRSGKIRWKPTIIPSEEAMQCMTAAGVEFHRYNDLLHRAKKYYPKYIISDSTSKNLKFAKFIPGKLAISVLLPPNFWFKKTTNTNSHYPQVKIKNGVVKPKSGPLCKKSIGSSTNSIIHILWEEYSPEVCEKFIYEMEQYQYQWLLYEGFSLGISDCFATSYDEVDEMLADVDVKTQSVIERRGEGEITGDDCEAEIMNILNSGMNVGTSIAKTTMNKGDRNALNIARLSGAKGSFVNLTQIIAAVGQQSINGNRVPMFLKSNNGKRCLPFFEGGDISPEARGFVKNSFMKGLTPQEYFFHAAGGREGIISTAIRTSDTGYIQKRIARKLEDCVYYRDGTVRDASGMIVQFLYGGDGMDAKKIYPVRGVPYPFFCDCVSISKRLNSDAIRSKEITEKDKKRCLYNEEIELLFSFINSHVNSPVCNQHIENVKKNLRSSLKYVKLYECKIADFCVEIRDRFENSKAQHGDAVGLIATTSIGEVNTQFALNVFHLAGYKGKDVSLGIPRFNELLNATRSGKQKKPSMTLFFEDERINENTELLRALRKNPSKNTEIIAKLRKDNFKALAEKKIHLEKVFIRDFLDRTEMKYLSNIDPEKGVSPIKIFDYEAYSEDWWVILSKRLGDSSEDYLEFNSWVIGLYFNVKELHSRKMELLDIADVIEEASDGCMVCLCSPLNLGRIEVYMNFENLKDMFKKTTEFSDDTSHLITRDNIDFFLCRDVALDFIKNLPVRGINGIEKSYPVEDSITKEWKMDTKGVNFLETLATPGIEPYNTTCDDMWSIFEVLGVEATRNFLVEEFTRVISFDGTYINPRHIELLVDSMLKSGSITAVRRDGISRNVGPISKIMFEQAIDNAAQASVRTEVDRLESIASCIMFGKPVRLGTGLAEVQSINKAPIHTVKLGKN